jgi:hypothetical protein
MKAYNNYYISLTVTNEDNLLYTLTGSHQVARL